MVIFTPWLSNIPPSLRGFALDHSKTSPLLVVIFLEAPTSIPLLDFSTILPSPSTAEEVVRFCVSVNALSLIILISPVIAMGWVKASVFLE